jgi:hypothetical protein
MAGLILLQTAEEAGIEAENVANSGTMDFKRLGSFWDI